MKLFQTEKDKMCERISEGLVNLVSDSYQRQKESIREIYPDFNYWQTFDMMIKHELTNTNYLNNSQNKEYSKKILERFADNLLKKTDDEINPSHHAYIIYQNTAPKKASILKEIIPYSADTSNLEDFDFMIKEILGEEK